MMQIEYLSHFYEHSVLRPKQLQRIVITIAVLDTQCHYKCIKFKIGSMLRLTIHVGKDTCNITTCRICFTSRCSIGANQNHGDIDRTPRIWDHQERFKGSCSQIRPRHCITWVVSRICLVKNLQETIFRYAYSQHTARLMKRLPWRPHTS